MNWNPWKRIGHNWQVKLYMFLLAVLLWLFVVLNQVYETGIDVPLDVIELKPGKILVSDVPKSVAVRFSGKGKDLLVMRYLQPARMELDIHTINYFYDYPLQTEFVVVPPGLDVTPLYIIGPDTVNIRIEDELTQRLPIKPQIEIRPDAGYTMSKSVSTDPESVTVAGPQSVVRRLRDISTEQRIFVGLHESSQQDIPLLLPDKRVRLTPTHVRAEITIDKIGERAFPRVPVNALHIPDGRSVILEPSTVDLRVQGATSLLAAMTPDSVTVTVDLSHWQATVSDYPPYVKLPMGVEVMDLNPETIRVRLEAPEAP